MLPWLIGGAIIGIGALILDDASSSNKKAKKKYNNTYNASLSTINSNYQNAQKKDTLDKLYKVKKAKVKIADTIYKDLQSYIKNFNKINQDIKSSKISLNNLFEQKRMSDNKGQKRVLQENINIMQLSRKELFSIKDLVQNNISSRKKSLNIANNNTKSIITEINNIKNS